MQEHAREANRVQKVLETANIKLGDVATDVLGASGRAMLKALIAGERDPDTLAALAQGRLRQKEAELREALAGRFTEHHAFMLEGLLTHIEFLDRQIELFDRRLPLELEGGEPRRMCGHQIGCPEPVAEGHACSMHHGPCRNRDLVATRPALQQRRARDGICLSVLTPRTPG